MDEQRKIPMAFSSGKQMGEETIFVLAGDVGGTKTNLALFKASGKEVVLLQVSTYHSSDYSSVTDIIKKFLTENSTAKPARISLGVAGPVFQGHASITNLPWHIEAAEIAGATGILKVTLINDLEATAYGLAGLSATDFYTLHEGDPASQGNMAVLAPGTGLGEAGLYWDGKFYHPFATEGGHSDFSCRDANDLALHDFLLKKYKVVSWESVIAGPAIHDTYNFLIEVGKKTEAAWIRSEFEKKDPSAVISEAAIEGKDPVCVETMQLFVKYLARESANLVLKLKATGGLFLGGGIPPKIISLLQTPDFYHHFMDCDRMQDLISRVPVKLILNDKTALIGAGWYGAYYISE